MRDRPINAFVFAPLILALGVAMIVRAIAAGGGPLSLGVVLGVLFVALGALRIYGAVRGG